MKVVKALSALLLSATLIAPSASAATKSTDLYIIEDIDPSYRFYDSIERFINADIIDGYVESESFEEDGEVYEYSYVNVRPEEKVTRAQFTKILVSALSLKAGTNTQEFADVKKAKWHYDYIRTASSLGIVAGYKDGKFHPDASITREQMAAMIYRAFKDTVEFPSQIKTFKDIAKTSFAYDAVTKLAAKGIVMGYGDTFKPNDLATRGQAIAIIDRALYEEPGSAENSSGVMNIVNRSITEELQLMKAQDTAGLEALYKEIATGYYLSYSLESLGLGEEIEEEPDTTFSVEQVGAHSLDMIKIRKRMAEVRVDDLTLKVSFTSSDMSFSANVDASGIAYLKKDANGVWKIYHLQLDDESEELLEAEISEAVSES